MVLLVWEGVSVCLGLGVCRWGSSMGCCLGMMLYVSSLVVEGWVL